MIELKDITRTFNSGRPNEFTALKGITTTIHSHEITILKGPSGSGKSTLLSIIGCMARPTSGRIWLNGKEITSLPERFLAIIRRETFGFIFQQFNLIRGITVLENVMLPAYPTGIEYKAIKERAFYLLDRFRIVSKANQNIENLSGGEQQRAAIARALINSPSFIIADEPTAHLDTALSERLLYLLGELKRENKTVIITSHDPLVYESDLTENMIELRDGNIINQWSAKHNLPTIKAGL
jgi:putative ABC transport system ATP-binding protein